MNLNGVGEQLEKIEKRLDYIELAVFNHLPTEIKLMHREFLIEVAFLRQSIKECYRAQSINRWLIIGNIALLAVILGKLLM